MTPDEYRTRCRLSERCLPPAEYRTLLTQLHDDLLAEIEGQADRIQDIYKQLDDTEKEVDDLRLLLRQALEALETGRDYVFEAAETFHVEMGGYKQQRHEAMDEDVKQIDTAITAIEERLK